MTAPNVLALAERVSLIRAYEAVIADLENERQFWTTKATQAAEQVERPTRVSEPHGLRVSRRNQLRMNANTITDLIDRLQSRIASLTTKETAQ
jgi:hypothetical protein